MIITMLNWIYYSITFWVLGTAFMALWKRDEKNSIRVGWTEIIMIGFCLSLIFSLWTSIFFPLDLIIQITYTLIVVLVLMVLIWKKRWVWPRVSSPKNWLTWLLIVIVFVLIFVNSLNRPSNPDTGIYHAQTIRWIESYPVVPGLANIHTRFGFNSSWLVVNALFSFHQIFPQSLHILPGFLFFIVCAALIQNSVSFARSGKAIPAFFGVIAVILLLETNIAQSSSPGTDLPAILFVIYLTFMFMSWLMEERRSMFSEIAVVLFSFTVLTIKLSTLPVILFLLWFLIGYIRHKQWQHLLWFFLLAGLVLIPWCVRSVMMTGYLVYPIPFPDIFSFDWKIPAEHLIIEQEVIRSWGKMPGVPYKQVTELSFLNWAKPWFYDFSLNRKILLGLSFLSPLSLLLLGFKAVRRYLSKQTVRGVLYIEAVLYAGLIYWFLSAPDIRFGYTIIIPLLSVMFSLLAIPVILLVKKYFAVHLLVSGVLILAIVFSGQMFVRSINMDMINNYWLYPSDYPKLPTYPCEIGDQTLLCAELYNECWYAPFPCIPNPKPQAVMRGENFGSGFRLK